MGTVTRAIQSAFILFVVGISAISAAPQSKVFDSAGIPIRYLEEGQGEAVILIHGFLGSAETWVRNGVLAELAKDYPSTL